MIVAEDWIPEFLRPQIDEVFAGRGLVPLLTLTGMATEQLLPTTQSSKLNCVSVSLEMRRAVADINAISNNLFSFREALERSILAGDGIWHTRLCGKSTRINSDNVSDKR